VSLHNKQRGRLSTAMLCCGLENNGMVGAWHGHGMASVNQTRPHCVNQMAKTHSKPLAARHGRGKAWARHGHGMLCVNRPIRRKCDRGCIVGAVALRRTAWSEHGMASVNQTRPHCVTEMAKTHSKRLAARHGRGMLCVNRPLTCTVCATLCPHLHHCSALYVCKLRA